MKLRKGQDFRLQSRYLTFSALTIAVLWLVGVGLAASRSDTLVRSSNAAPNQVVQNTRPHQVLPLSSNVLQAQATQAGSVDKPLLAGDVFKNVPALKDVPVDDFMASMGLMCASVAADCADCHVNAGTEKVDWAADTPRKITARRMVNMVRGINQQYFGGRTVVSCFTCHHNRDKPMATPTMDILYGEPTIYPDDLFPAAPGAPAAGPILDKYIEALGGAQRVNGLTSFAATATSVGFGGFGGGGQVRIFAKAPDKRTTIIEFKDAPGRDESTRTYNGRAGWMKTPLSVLGEYVLSGTELDGARLDALLSFPGQIKQVLTNLRVGNQETIDGKLTQVVQGEGPRGMVATLYFDQSSGLLTRLIRYGRSPIGRQPTQVDYADYRDVDGVKMPFKWTLSWLDGRDSFELTNIRKNVAINDAVFGRPAEALAAAR